MVVETRALSTQVRTIASKRDVIEMVIGTSDSKDTGLSAVCGLLGRFMKTYIL